MANSNCPLVSIIMPAYNRAAYIKETIESILAQTYTNWELLIFDDGSEDNTKEVVASIPDKRIKYQYYEHLGLTGELKNRGIQQASGELIALMDSDDLWMADKLELQVATLLENTGAGFSITNGYNFFADDTPVEFFYEQRTGTEVKNIFIGHCTGRVGVRTPTVLFRKSCIQKAGLFSTKYTFTDFSFFGELSYHYNAVIVYTPLLKCRKHPSNSRYNGGEYFEALDLFVEKKMLLPHIAKDAKFVTAINSGNARVHYKRWKEAFHLYMMGWGIKPYSAIPVKKMAKTALQMLLSKN